MPAQSEIRPSAHDAPLQTATPTPAWRAFDPANPPLALSVLPGAIVAMIFGIAGMARNMKYARLADVTMPDAWMQELAKAGDLSEDGLEYLASLLACEGRISLEDALNWVAIEDKAIRRGINAGGKKNPKSASKIAIMKIMGGINWPALKEELELLGPSSDMRRKLGAAALLERSGRVVEMAEG